MNENPRGYVIAERELLCPLCKCDKFYKKNIKLNNTIANLMGIEENIRSVNGYICNECSHIISFVDQ
jgi:predicted nucleic-acid-binding Zn-ribbon protein